MAATIWREGGMRAIEVFRSRSPLLAMRAVAVLSLIWLAAMETASMAQEPSIAPLANEKVETFIKMLDDPDIRAWLESKPMAPAENPSAPAAFQIATWESAIRNHFIAMRNAFPRIPGEAASAVRIVRTEINNHGFATILVLFAALLALGFGAEWLFRRALSGMKQPGSGQAAGVAAREEGLAVKLLSELAPLVVFSLVSAGVFLASNGPDCCASSS
jgi:moderate conductance mechanosensitive channel